MIKKCEWIFLFDFNSISLREYISRSRKDAANNLCYSSSIRNNQRSRNNQDDNPDDPGNVHPDATPDTISPFSLR